MLTGDGSRLIGADETDIDGDGVLPIRIVTAVDVGVSLRRARCRVTRTGVAEFRILLSLGGR